MADKITPFVHNQTKTAERMNEMLEKAKIITAHLISREIGIMFAELQEMLAAHLLSRGASPQILRALEEFWDVTYTENMSGEEILNAVHGDVKRRD